MGIFNWFGEQEHNPFDYKPVFYDKEKEERRRKFGDVEASSEGQSDKYVPGTYIRGSMRDGKYQKSVRSGSKAQNVIGFIGLVLVVIVLLYIANFFTLL